MGVLYRNLVRPVAFRRDAEAAHEQALTLLGLAHRSPPFRALLRRTFGSGAFTRPVSCMGLTFPNRVGLAAGFDKDARTWKALGALGFGHVEIGTVTALPQPGNERPRLFRYPGEKALVNRLGFNNAGAEAIARRIRREAASRKARLVLGVNIGKSRAASIEQAADDYRKAFSQLAPLADYITLNVSSPNTPGLRHLQSREALTALLTALNQEAEALERPVPLVIKIAPDLTFRELDAVLEVALEQGVFGIIATNTTIDRSGPRKIVAENGGLSGPPLHRMALDRVNYIARAAGERLAIIGCGGIHNPDTAAAFTDRGADLVQLYTGMVYEGPDLPGVIARALSAREAADWVYWTT